MNSRLTKNQIRRYLKTLPTFLDRLRERRRLGQDAETIARYVHTTVEQSRNPRCRMAKEVHEETLHLILSEDELAAYRRITAANWARFQRSRLRAMTVEREKKQMAEINHSRSAAVKDQRHQQAKLRRCLLEKGAVTISEVARRLDLPIATVRKLNSAGDLPSDGFVPVQHSYGKPVHLWLPETILRYLNRAK